MTAAALTAREILDRLVAFPTVSRESNLPLVDWVEGYLAGYGVAATRVWNEERTKAGLFANIGPEVADGVVLSAHTDVVPVDGQDWTVDPWAVTERDGRLYGRGTTDMKGFVALALAAVPRALRADLRRPLQLAFSYDEEVGLLGAPPLVAAMNRDLPKAAAVIVGEPTGMRPVTGHKGGASFWIDLRGYEIHSSNQDRGVSAVMEAGRLIQWANDRNAEAAAATPTPLAAPFDPPYTTVHVGMISGGTAHNITAKDCRLHLGFRTVPDETSADWAARLRAEVARVEAGMQAVRPETRITLTPMFDGPGLAPEADGAAERLVRRLTGDNGTHVVSYGTDAGHFQAGGYSAVVCGPGDIAVAHQPDEYITVAQFEAGGAFLDRLIAALES